MYDTKMKSIVGTRLDKVTVIKHLEYVSSDDDVQEVAPRPTESAPLEDSEVMF